ncbi:MAG TPA: Gfo/Idh/MocA family oxidoreductase [Tepidisphaeraceae bacterium]
MLNFALVGCGGMAHWHAQQLQKIPEVKVVALMDTVRAQTESFKQKYFPEAIEFDSYEKLLEQPPAKLDAVLLVTPHTLHYPQSKAALERGINVLCEKPMVTNCEHAYDLWRTQKRSGKLMAIAIQAPYTQEYQCLARMRDSGKLGKISMISGWLSQGWMNATKGKWRQDPALSGGGQMYDSGAHVLNGIMWLVNSPVVEVGCFYDKCGTAVDINGVGILKFQNGTLGSLAIGGSGVNWDVSINIQTDKLVAKTAPHGGWLEMTGPGGKKIYPQIEENDHPAAGTPHLNFVNALLGKEKPIAPVRYGVLLSALMDALYESADTQKLVRVKPVPDDV